MDPRRKLYNSNLILSPYEKKKTQNEVLLHPKKKQEMISQKIKQDKKRTNDNNLFSPLSISEASTISQDNVQSSSEDSEMSFSSREQKIETVDDDTAIEIDQHYALSSRKGQKIYLYHSSSTLSLSSSSDDDEKNNGEYFRENKKNRKTNTNKMEDDFHSFLYHPQKKKDRQQKKRKKYIINHWYRQPYSKKIQIKKKSSNGPLPADSKDSIYHNNQLHKLHNNAIISTLPSQSSPIHHPSMQPPHPPPPPPPPFPIVPSQNLYPYYYPPSPIYQPPFPVQYSCPYNYCGQYNNCIASCPINSYYGNDCNSLMYNNNNHVIGLYENFSCHRYPSLLTPSMTTTTTITTTPPLASCFTTLSTTNKMSRDDSAFYNNNNESLICENPYFF